MGSRSPFGRIREQKVPLQWVDAWQKKDFGFRRFGRKVAHTPLGTVYHTQSEPFVSVFGMAK
jgi:hypothetical protein